MQMCEARMAPPYYAPCTGYKLTAEWAMKTYDRQVRALLASSGCQCLHGCGILGLGRVCVFPLMRVGL